MQKRSMIFWATNSCRRYGEFFMPKFLLLSLPVYGRIGPRSVVDPSIHPPSVKRLHHIFDYKPIDDLFQCFPCFLVSPKLARILSRSRLIGFALREAIIQKSGTFSQLNPRLPTPEA